MGGIALSPQLLNLAYKVFDVEALNSPEPSERNLEYSLVLSKACGYKVGKALDIGCTSSSNIVPFFLSFLGWSIEGLDTRTFKLGLKGFHFTKGDSRDLPFDANTFALVTLVSTLEHIGVPGRYGIKLGDPFGDSITLESCRRVLVSGGNLLMTVPVGPQGSLSALSRVYTLNEVWALFARWSKVLTQVWTKDGINWSCVQSPCGERDILFVEASK